MPINWSTNSYCIQILYIDLLHLLHYVYSNKSIDLNQFHYSIILMIDSEYRVYILNINK